MRLPQGEDAEPPPNENEHTPMQEEACKQTVHGETKEEQNSQADKEIVNKILKATLTTCKPVAATRPKIELPSCRINTQIQYMKDHALIGKFIGFLPTEKVMQGWIAAKWKLKGHITLQLGPKGFFTMVFNCLEDRNKILDGGSYFFNVAGLYLRDWVEDLTQIKKILVGH